MGNAKGETRNVGALAFFFSSSSPLVFEKIFRLIFFSFQRQFSKMGKHFIPRIIQVISFLQLERIYKSVVRWLVILILAKYFRFCLIAAIFRPSNSRNG